jgi:hypothetical protein
MQLPDTRGWALLGLFLLTTYLFTLVAINPKLADVQLFGVLATAVISGGFGGALGFFFGSSKSGADKDATIATQLDKQP